MTYKTIPAVGEVFLGGSPHPLKVMKCVFGRSSGLETWVTSSQHTTVRTIFSLPAGCLVDHVTMYFKKGFNTTLISLGDTANSSGWFNTASTAWKATSNTRNSLNTAAPVSLFKGSKYYAAASLIKMKSTTHVTTGEVHIYLFYSLAPNQ